jgi:type VI secretion system secreted protein Hcp
VVGVAGGGAAFAVASVPDGNGVIHACVQLQGTVPALSPNVRIIDPNATPPQQCTTPVGGVGPAESSIAWNTAGPQGVPGTPGATGGQGAPGAPGQTLTINGESFTINGGRTATLTSPPTLAPFQISGNTTPIATLSFTGGVRTALARQASAQLNGIEGLDDILAWGFTAQSAASGHGISGGEAKPKLGDLRIVKSQDKSTPKLALACANGVHFPKATLYVRKSGGGQALTLTLTNALISSYSMSSGGDRPTESLTINFTKIEFQYTKQDKTPSDSKPITTLHAIHL